MSTRYAWLRDGDEECSPVFVDVDTLLPVLPKYTGIVGTSGLRRQILVSDKGRLVETPDQLPITPLLLPHLIKHHKNFNGWNFDAPNLAVERKGDGPARDLLKAKLEAMCSYFPYTFRIVGLQRRYLMYFSDGNYQHQRRYIRLAPHPDITPFTAAWRLKAQYTKGPTVEQVNAALGRCEAPAGLPVPTKGSLSGFGAPLLYDGPAWVVRFEVDDQNPAFGRCRVYVQDDGTFICSDWCQRDGVDKYKEGIDLQSGLSYSFDTWILGPCIKRATQQGVFKPKSVASTKTVEIRSVLKAAKAVMDVPSLEELLKKRQPALPPLVDQGYTDEEIYEVLAERLAQGQLDKMHGIPVCLGSEQAASPKFANATIDAGKSAKGTAALLDVQPGAATMLAAHYMVIDRPRLRLMLRGLRKPVVSLPPAPVLTVDILAEAEARFSAQVEERRAAVAAATAVPTALPTGAALATATAVCPQCSLRIEDGKVCADNKCYGPQQDQCLFKAAKVAVPAEARLAELTYPEFGPPLPSPSSYAGKTCGACHLQVLTNGQVQPLHYCFKPTDPECLFAKHHQPVPPAAHKVGIKYSTPAGKPLTPALNVSCDACGLEVTNGAADPHHVCYHPKHEACVAKQYGLIVPQEPQDDEYHEEEDYQEEEV